MIKAGVALARAAEETTPRSCTGPTRCRAPRRLPARG